MGERFVKIYAERSYKCIGGRNGARSITCIMALSSLNTLALVRDFTAAKNISLFSLLYFLDHEEDMRFTELYVKFLENKWGCEELFTMKRFQSHS